MSTMDAYGSARNLLTDVYNVLSNCEQLDFAHICYAYSGRVHDNPTFKVVVAVGICDTTITGHYDQASMGNIWSMKVTVFADMAMPLEEGYQDAWQAYLHMSDVLSGCDWGPTLQLTECGTPRYDRESRAFVTRAKFVFDFYM